MGKLNVDELRPGMTLADDVHGIHGRKLFPAGVEIGEDQIRIMKAWGVTEAEVEGVTQQDVENETSRRNDKYYEGATRFMEATFRGTQQGNAFLAELFRLCILRTADRLEKGTFKPMTDETMRMLLEKAATPEPEAGILSAEELVREQVALLSFPDVYLRILKELESPACSARRLGDIVSMDTGLAAKILRLVNSPFYGFPSSIDSIERAITILGANELTTLALGISAVSCFSSVPSGVLNMQNFWEHSLSCGIISRLIAGQKRGLSEERFFVGGLLHDIGMLLLVRRLPHAMCRAFLLSRKRKVPLNEAELEIFSFDHATVGSMLLKEWSIPESLVDMVRYHHAPLEPAQPLDAGIIHLSDIVAMALRNEDYGAFFAPFVPQEVMDVVSIPASSLESMLKVHDRQIHDVMQIFLGDE